MASQKQFSINPTVSITRSMFKRPSQHKTSMKLGEITPIYLEEVLPGDTFKVKMSSLVRMSTPVVPLMDNVHIDYYAFYCPSRLLFNHWKEFMGENTSSAGIYSGTEYVIPTTNIYASGITSGSLGDHLGLPLVTADASKSLKVSVLPGRMYVLLYNEWFRDQNLISPQPLTLSDTGQISSSLTYDSSLFVAAKESDYFTRALPYAQKGGAVSLPLGTVAPVITGAEHGTDAGIYFKPLVWHNTGGNKVTGSADLGIDTGNTAYGSTAFVGQEQIVPGNLWADLNHATAATINQLRFAFQYQKMLEKDAMYGTRYWEILKGHFSISAPDSSLQRPQLLGSLRHRVNVDQVLQTAPATIGGSTSTLGTPGANSVTGNSGELFTFSSVEHGYIMILAVARHDQTYGQGVSRLWTRSRRTQFYFPVFANLGAQEIKNKEIFATGTSSDDNVFGYQESWAEYRYKPSICTADLRPSNVNLAPWTLANNFGSLPTLGKVFIEQDRNNIARALVTGSSGPDFICDFYFDEITIRPMPLYSIPGLIDHH